MKTVRDILQEKGFDIFSIPPEASVYQALRYMAEKNVGALVVMNNDAVVGMMSERDYARKIVLKGRLSKDVPVKEIMTADIVRVHPDQDIETCMELMNTRRVRHLPVFDADRLIGIVSIGDIVSAIIAHKEDVIEQLENYIKGKR